MNRNTETLMQNSRAVYCCCVPKRISLLVKSWALSVYSTVMMDWSPFDGGGDSDLIQDNSLLGGDRAATPAYRWDLPGNSLYRPAGQNASAFAAGRVSGGDETCRRAGYSAGCQVTGDFEFGGGF